MPREAPVMTATGGVTVATAPPATGLGINTIVARTGRCRARDANRFAPGRRASRPPRGGAFGPGSCQWPSRARGDGCERHAEGSDIERCPNARRGDEIVDMKLEVVVLPVS